MAEREPPNGNRLAGKLAQLAFAALCIYAIVTLALAAMDKDDQVDKVIDLMRPPWDMQP